MLIIPSIGRPVDRERHGPAGLGELSVAVPRPTWLPSAGRASKGKAPLSTEKVHPSPPCTAHRLTPEQAQTRGIISLLTEPGPSKASRAPYWSSNAASQRLATRGKTTGLPLAFRRTPSSRYMTVYELYRLINAVNFAEFVGAPTNSLLTVTWKDQPDFRTLGWHHLERQFLQGMSHWLQRQSIRPAYAYFRENISGRGKHNHILLHLPPARAADLRSALFDYLHARFRFNVKAAVQLKRAPGPVGLVKYAAKALDPAETFLRGDKVVSLVEFLGIDPEQQAEVEIQRIGCTRNLDQKARSDAGFSDIDDILTLQRAFEPRSKTGRTSRRQRRSALAPTPHNGKGAHGC